MNARFHRCFAACGLAAFTLMITACSSSDGPGNEDLERVGSAIARGEATLSIPALSRRVIEDQGDFRIVDLRPAAQFEAGHIPGAVNAAVTEVIRPGQARELAGERQLVLYSADGIASSQAVALLQLNGIDAVTLQGGFDTWQAYTSDPSVELPGQQPVLDAAERQALRTFFHGEAQTQVAAHTPQVTPARQDRAAALGLGPAPAAQTAAAPAYKDPHGLGLQYGLGIGIDFELPVAEEKAAETPAPRRLLIGEGC